MSETQWNWQRIPRDCPRPELVHGCRTEADYMELSAKTSFPGGSDGKESASNVEDSGSILGLGRSPGKGMAIHSSILAWKIPWTEEPGGLQCMGLHRVRQDGACMHAHQPRLASWERPLWAAREPRLVGGALCAGNPSWVLTVKQGKQESSHQGWKAGRP